MRGAAECRSCVVLCAVFRYAWQWNGWRSALQRPHHKASPGEAHLAAHGVIYLLFVYGKDEQSTLSRDQKKRLEVVVDSIKREWANQ